MRIVVSAVDAGRRLDHFLSGLSLFGSRSHIKGLIKAGGVTVNGRRVKAGYRLHAHEVVEVLPPAERPPFPQPQNIPLDILYEDAHLAVINKPAGMVVHPGAGRWEGTVVNALLGHWQGLQLGGDPLRPGIVHRLDKETSGVLVVAKDPQTLEALAGQFQRREVSKAYLAVVAGCPELKTGKIHLPIGRHSRDRKKMSVRSLRGKEALSCYRVLEDYEGASLVRLFPKTGRTHQLRVHLATMGHPIVGDKVYGSTKALRGGVHPEKQKLLQTFPRQALHAESIRFLHPQKGTVLEVHAPLPDDFAALLAALRRNL